MMQNRRDVRTKKQIITTLWCSASSVAYLKKLNQHIILFADKFAKDMLSYLPYEKIYPLNIPNNTPTYLWAQGKFFALKDMQLGDIHIDSDVFIKTQKLTDIIKYGVEHSDLIIQSIEDEDHTRNDFYQNCFDFAKICDINFLYGADNKHKPAYNCGLVGFNSDELKYKYLSNYMNILEQLTDNKQAEKLANKTKCWPDLLFEQKNLFDIAKDYKIFNLLGTGKEAYKNALRYGYQHILGDGKWNQLYDIKLQLKNLNEDIYYQTQETIDYILDTLNTKEQ